MEAENAPEERRVAPNPWATLSVHVVASPGSHGASEVGGLSVHSFVRWKCPTPSQGSAVMAVERPRSSGPRARTLTDGGAAGALWVFLDATTTLDARWRPAVLVFCGAYILLYTPHFSYHTRGLNPMSGIDAR